MPYLPPYQVAHYAYDAGFRGNALVTAVAVADAESHLNTSAVNPSHTCFGLWQIAESNNIAAASTLLNPTYNAKLAYTISHHGTNWNPWTVYTNGWYKRYWSVAQAAVQSLAHPTYPHLNVRVNSSSFPAIASHNETYLLWTVLDKWGIPNHYLGNGKFNINGKIVQGIVDGGNTYLPWAAVPEIHVTKSQGTFHFTDSYAKSPTYPSLRVMVDGKPFTVISDHSETYLLWTVLIKWGIPHQYLGQGKFSINGHPVQGIVYKGNTYLNWAAIPGIEVAKVNGEFHFTDSH